MITQNYKYCILFFTFDRTITNIVNLDDEDGSVCIDDACSTIADEIVPLKRRRSSSNGDQIRIFENIAQSIKENGTKRSEMIQKILSDSKQETELELFFGSICKTVSKFTPFDQAKMKMRIQNLVSETELAHIERMEQDIMNKEDVRSFDTELVKYGKQHHMDGNIINSEHIRSFDTVSYDDGTSYFIEEF